jgi:hypothetical protein
MLLELLENDIQLACELRLAEANARSQGSNALANPNVNIIVASHEVLRFYWYRPGYISIFQLTAQRSRLAYALSPLVAKE